MHKFIAMGASILLAGGIASADQEFESFETADSNDDGSISKDEFYGLVSDAGIYADWDYDADGFIEANEFDEIGLDDEDFSTWDVDNDTYLNTNEFYDGYFTTFDEDENGHWDGYEWDDAGDGGLFDV